MSWFSRVQKDEQWVVSEVAKGWAALDKGVAHATIDIKGLFDYVAQHQTQIDGIAQTLLSDVNVIAALAGQPEVAATATAIGASAQIITNLAANMDKGSVPLSQVVDALHAVKDSQTAVNALVKRATARPSK